MKPKIAISWALWNQRSIYILSVKALETLPHQMLTSPASCFEHHFSVCVFPLAINVTPPPMHLVSFINKTKSIVLRRHRSLHQYVQGAYSHSAQNHIVAEPKKIRIQVAKDARLGEVACRVQHLDFRRTLH